MHITSNPVSPLKLQPHKAEKKDHKTLVKQDKEQRDHITNKQYDRELENTFPSSDPVAKY